MNWIEKISLPAYLLGAALTYGFVAAEQAEHPCQKQYIQYESCLFPGFKGGFAGVIWPAYWPFRLSWDLFAHIRGSGDAR